MEQPFRSPHSTKYLNPADKSRQLNCGALRDCFSFSFLILFSKNEKKKIEKSKKKNQKKKKKFLRLPFFIFRSSSSPSSPSFSVLLSFYDVDVGHFSAAGQFHLFVCFAKPPSVDESKRSLLDLKLKRELGGGRGSGEVRLTFKENFSANQSRLEFL